jgi:hypothetical protein
MARLYLVASLGHPTNVNEATLRQLALVAEIAGALDRAGLDWWLFGGWAMDFHAGRVTRDHSDVEFFVWEHEGPAVRAKLVGAGFLAVPGLHPDEGQPFLKDGQELGAWYLRPTSGGGICTPGRWADWLWPDGAFAGPRARIGDVEAPAMSIAGLLDMKANFAQHAHGAPARAKDLADIDLLKAMLERPGA